MPSQTTTEQPTTERDAITDRIAELDIMLAALRDAKEVLDLYMVPHHPAKGDGA